jgi:general secretion pathway protein L
MVEKVLVQSADTLRALELLIRQFATWWLRELRVLLPNVTLASGRETQSVLMITPGPEAISFHLNFGAGEQRAQWANEAITRARLDQWLAEAGTTREQVTVSLGLDQSLFFVRDIVLPRAAVPALHRILDQELVRRTPFDPSSVWHGGTATDGKKSADVAEIRHWIVRRDRVDFALRQVGLAATDVDFLAVIDGSGEALGTIPMRQLEMPEPVWVRRAILLLTFLAIVVLTVNLALVGNVQSRAVDRLDEELAAARTSIGVTKSGALSRLLLQKSEVPVAAIWDELSRILPDHTHLEELRIADGKVLLSGFSRDAPDLVRVISRSELFEQVRLEGAIVPNAGEGKDRFGISCVIKRGRKTGS